MKKTVIATAIGFSLLGHIVYAAPLNERIEAIKYRYQPQIAALQAQMNELSNNMPTDTEIGVSVDFETEWEEQVWKLDIPECGMYLQRLVFDVPEVSMRLQRWVFDIPATGMRVTDVFGIGKMHLPQFWTERKEIKLHIPEFKMSRVEVKLHVPECAMRTQTWKVRIPTFKVKDAKAEVKKRAERGEALGEQVTALSEQMGEEVSTEVRTELVQTRVETSAKFDKAIKKMEPYTGHKEVAAALLKVRAQKAEVLLKLDAEIEKVK